MGEEKDQTDDTTSSSVEDGQDLAQHKDEEQSDASHWAEFKVCLAFFSRLPIPPVTQHVDMRDAWWAAPLAGGAIGLCASLVLGLFVGLGMTPFLASVFAVATLLIVTGALHEDGLSDMADGFGGGATKERKLEIMHDSRVGSYGAAAIGLSLLARVAALTALTEAGGSAAAVSLIVSGALSRYISVLTPHSIEPARADGLAQSMGAITSHGIQRGAVATLAMLILGWALGVPFLALLLCTIGATLAGYAVMQLAKKQIGGYTGDVLGAVQQATEIAFLSALVMALAT